MALQTADRVQETTTTTGTGALTLAGAVPGFQRFSAMCAVGDTCEYAIVDGTANAWEVGLGTYSAANTLTRTTVYASSSNGAAITLAGNAGTVVFDTLAATTVSLLRNLLGSGVNGRSRSGGVPYANGQFAAAGDAQTCVFVMRGVSNSTTSIRLTTDGASASASNCINIAQNSAMSLRIDLIGIDTTNPVNVAHARWDDLYMSRGTGNPSLAGTGAPTSQGAGTMSGASYGVTTDANGFALLVSAPNANLTHWVARVTTVEVG